MFYNFYNFQMAKLWFDEAVCDRFAVRRPHRCRRNERLNGHISGGPGVVALHMSLPFSYPNSMNAFFIAPIFLLRYCRSSCSRSFKVPFP